MENQPPHDYQADIDAIEQIASVPSILDVIRQTTGMGFVAVARVTEGRWIACKVLDDIDFGLKPGGELVVETTICHEIRGSYEPVAIDNVAESPVYATHHTPLQYGFQSYISVPIVLKDGSFFGTLCAIDPRPAEVNNSKTLTMFRLFAEMIAQHLDAREHIVKIENQLQAELEIAEIREQFIAILGHDLRNPLASIVAGTRMLAKSALDDRAKSVVSLMLKSSDRMASLVDNIMDFARGRLGGGISLHRTDQPLQPTLEQVVEEMRSIWTERDIIAEFDITRPIMVDHARLAQLFSNLLGNALTHGSPTSPVIVKAACSSDSFDLWIANAGEPIPPQDVERLFQPFTRPMEHGSKQGLGLGLYIASKIAEAHGGTLSVTSAPDETRFTLNIPVR